MAGSSKGRRVLCTNLPTIRCLPWSLMVARPYARGEIKRPRDTIKPQFTDRDSGEEYPASWNEDGSKCESRVLCHTQASPDIFSYQRSPQPTLVARHVFEIAYKVFKNSNIPPGSSWGSKSGSYQICLFQRLVSRPSRHPNSQNFKCVRATLQEAAGETSRKKGG
jgi:hypothetical protein